jgi:hypothetical protein
LYFLFFVDSFVIGFTIVEIPSVVISKKNHVAENAHTPFNETARGLSLECRAIALSL